MPVPTLTPILPLYPSSGPDPISVYISSLHRIASLPVKMVLPGHGEAFTDMQSKIEGTFKFVERKAGALLAALAGESLNAYTVAAQMRLQFLGVDWEQLDLSHRCAAIQEAIAFLEFLRFDGRVVRHESDGVYYYARA